MMSMASAQAGQMKMGVASQASTPSATSSRVGTSLPRSIRARLGQSGMRKRPSSKLSASNVRRGDEKSTLYSSLSREGEHKAPSSSPGTDKSLAASAARKESKSKRAAKAKGKFQPHAPVAKLNPRNLRFIQQAQRRGLDHIRPAGFKTMAVENAVRNGIVTC